MQENWTSSLNNYIDYDYALKRDEKLTFRPWRNILEWKDETCGHLSAAPDNGLLPVKHSYQTEFLKKKMQYPQRKSLNSCIYPGAYLTTTQAYDEIVRRLWWWPKGRYYEANK